MDRSDRAGPRRKLGAVSIATLVVLSSLTGVLPGGIGVVSAANSSTIEGTPQLNASAPDARLNPGQNGAVGITITNDATYDDNNATHPSEARSRAGEARSVSLDISDTRGAPLSVETGSQSIGTVQDGESSGPHSFNVVVDEDAAAGTYEMEVTTEYRHAEQVTYEEVADGEYAYNETVVTRTETDTITVVIEPEARFEVDSVDHDVPLGGEGTVTMEISNTGDEDVTETAVSVTSSDSNFYFGSGTATSEANVGDWDAGETKQFEFRAGTVESAVKREYPIDLSVSYTDSDGAQTSATEQLGITPTDRTEFTVAETNHDVPLNGEGTVTFTIEHTADKDIADVSVTASTGESELYFGSESSRSATAVVSEWEAEKERTFTFRVGTTENAVNRSYPIDVQFEYTDDADNDNARTETVEIRPGIRNQFQIGSVDHNVPRDGEGVLAVNVTQVANKQISDVAVTASTSDSAVYFGAESSRSSTAIIERWNNTEQRQLRFRVGTTEDALNRTYPIALSFEYTDETDNQNSRNKQVEIRPQAKEHLSIHAVEHNVPIDGVGQVTILANNTADRNFSDLSVTASTPDSEVYIGSESSRSGTATVSEWAAGQARSITFQVGTSANAVNRSYPLDLEFEYSDAADNNNQYTDDIEFRPRSEPQFTVQSIDHEVPIGSTGQVTLTVRNEGPVNASGTTLTIGSNTDAVYFGAGGTPEPIEAQGVVLEPPRTGTPTAQSYVGNWSVGETKTVSFRVGFDENAITRRYAAELSVSYENENGDDMPDRTKMVGIEPLAEQLFDFAAVESDLHVGEEGNLVGEIENVGNRSVEGVVVTAETQRETVNFYNARYAVGELEPGESERFRHRVGITNEAEHGPRLFEVSARYRDSQGDIQTTDSRDLTVAFGRDRDAFGLDTDATFEPGASGTLDVTVTNRRNETLSNVQAKLFTDDPLDSEDDSAFVPELAPGESTTVTLDLSVGGGASAKTYSASMDFRYDNARGESTLSDTYRVPVVVAQPESGMGLPVLIGGLGVVIVVGIAGWRFGAVDRLRDRIGEWRTDSAGPADVQE
ncbi:COG1361 S-layer family protein [Halorhabdus sp. CUG00001]|uniref:COG1361 S-layer family protein n=1 Tax=Halorhabdus sp. CUG00001 TaxID=2600297 RepID=UPI00131AC858|nr:hypothetical protein [Halorhabdus sp. CUG00001]